MSFQFSRKASKKFKDFEADFCIEAVGKILARERCEIFNTDQGAQFTSTRFTRPLRDQGIQVSMDGRGRVLAVDYTYLDPWNSRPHLVR
jgi:hypothetical protein